MAKRTADRRFKKRADDLGEMFANQREAFHKVWSALVVSWENEVLSRAKSQSRLVSHKNIPAIFSVLTKARKLAVSIGAEADPQVAVSLHHLEHVCSLAVAGVTDPKLYRLDRDCTERLREELLRNGSRG